MHALMALFLAALALTTTTAVHYEAMVGLQRRMHGERERMRIALPVAIVALVTAHLVEIGVYASVFWAADDVLHLGSLESGLPMGLAGFFYFAAETYSSLGYGDIIPTGTMRLIASVEPLNGLLLLSWSGAFLYAAVHSIDLDRPVKRGAGSEDMPATRPGVLHLDGPATANGAALPPKRRRPTARLRRSLDDDRPIP